MWYYISTGIGDKDLNLESGKAPCPPPRFFVNHLFEEKIVADYHLTAATMGTKLKYRL